MKEASPKEYRAYRNSVINFMRSEHQNLYSQIEREIRSTYENYGVNLTEDGLMDEIAANATESFLNDPEKFLDSISKDRSFGQKLCDFVNEFVKYLKDMFSHYDAKSTEAQVLLSDINQLEKAEQLWREAFEKSSESVVETGKDGRTYSVEKYTEHELDNWSKSKKIIVYQGNEQLDNFINEALKDASYNKKMYFGKMPSNVVDYVKDTYGLDISKANVSLHSYEIRKILLGKHGNDSRERLYGQVGVTKEDFKYIPDVITEPDMIKHKEGNHYNNNPILTFSKQIDNDYNVTAYFSVKSNDLRIQTMYIIAKKRSSPRGNDVRKSSILTSETNRETASFDNSISNSNDKINTLKKFSLNKNFEKEYDAWDHKDGRKHFILGTTSEALKEVGVGDKTVYMDAGKIIKILNKHVEMNDTLIKKIPDIIENPIMIMESSTNAGRITMFGETVSATNKPILVAMELNPTQPKGLKISDFAVVVSAYERNNANDFIKKSDMLWINPDKNKTDTWLKGTRLQLPFAINHYGLIRSISNSNEKNNTLQKNILKDTSGEAGEIKEVLLQTGMDKISALPRNNSTSFKEGFLLDQYTKERGTGESHSFEEDNSSQTKSHQSVERRILLIRVICCGLIQIKIRPIHG